MLGRLHSTSLKLRQGVNCGLEAAPAQIYLASLLLLVLLL